MNTSIRKIVASDIVDIVRIAEECNLSPWSRTDYIDEMGRSDAILLLLETEESRTIGFIVGRKVLGNDGDDDSRDAEIYNIGIAAEFQHLGHGTSLMKAFLTFCKKFSARSIWLDVRISNNSARSFYRKIGFFEVATRTHFYNNPDEDGIVMQFRPSRR